MTVKEFKKELNKKILPRHIALTHILNFDDGDCYEVQIRKVSTGTTAVIIEVWDNFTMARTRVIDDINFYDLHDVMEAIKSITERGE